MTSISLADPANHTLADATLIASNNALIEGVINGNIDNGNVVAGANLDGAKLANGTVIDSKLVQSGGVLANMPPGRELIYTELTVPVTGTATTEATANTVLTASAFTFDGTTPVWVEFFAEGVGNGTTGAASIFFLYDGAASIGEIGRVIVTADHRVPVCLKRRLAPSNASHTFSIRCCVTSGTFTVVAGTGGLATQMPGYIRISKA